MNKRQYNNVVYGTIRREGPFLLDNHLELVRRICKNLGVALPQGNCKTIVETLSNRVFMRWKFCGIFDAQETANNGVPVIGINENDIVVVPAYDEKSVLKNDVLFDEIKKSNGISNMQFFAYGNVIKSKRKIQPSPHGKYMSFSCKNPVLSYNGVGVNPVDKYQSSHTVYMDGILNANMHRYIVIPKNVKDFSKLLGSVGVVVLDNGSYEFGIVGDVGPSCNELVLNRFSVKLINDLGLKVDASNKIISNNIIKTYIFPDTSRNTWQLSTLNDDVEKVGRSFFF